MSYTVSQEYFMLYRETCREAQFDLLSRQPEQGNLG